MVEISKVVNTLKTIFSRLIRTEYADGINQIRVS
ncbi:MAG: hypothetical protein VKL00_09425 [Synechococcales bacterium]|nr:hypothetical protein [Synechococcales bacterium]